MMFKNKAKNIIACMLVCTMALSAFTACSDKEDKPQTGEVSTGSENNNEPLELTIHLHNFDRQIFEDDWPVFLKAAEMTGVKLKGTAPLTATNSEQVFNTMLASNELPDIINNTKPNLDKYGMQGALIPLNDLMDEYAPNYKKFLEENPDIRKAVTASDGNIYGIAMIGDGEAAEGYFIRTDWLEKLNLEVPKTVDDYYNVLKAFRENDPNGNNKKDEIPFIDRGKGRKTLDLVSLFGAHIGWYLEDDVVKYGPAQDEFKVAIANIAKWYAEGLIDPEAFTRGPKARDILLEDNVGGATHDWFGSTAKFNESLPDKIEGFAFEPIAPPADINGKVWESTIRSNIPQTTTIAWGISSNNQHPEETMKYFDFWWSEEGRRLMNFGIEGEQYDMVDGKPIFKDSVLNSDKTVLLQLEEIGAQIQLGFHQDFAYEEQWMNPIAKKGARMYIDGAYCEPAFPALALTEEEQKVIDDKWVAIDTQLRESSQKWILGAEDVNKAWDGYVEQFNKMGLEEITKIYQQAYERYLNQ